MIEIFHKGTERMYQSLKPFFIPAKYYIVGSEKTRYNDNIIFICEKQVNHMRFRSKWITTNEFAEKEPIQVFHKASVKEQAVTDIIQNYHVHFRKKFFLDKTGRECRKCRESLASRKNIELKS